MTTTMFGYIVRETEAAVAFVQPPLTAGMSALWVPKKKIDKTEEHDLFSVSIEMKGEPIRRMGRPVTLSIDTAFLEKIGSLKA
jgi:hypothetical protein